MSVVMVLTTVGSAEAAEELAGAVVVGRVGACVQMVPIRSVYRWEGEVRTDGEVLCLVKTDADRAEALTEFIAARHPYDEPEIVTVPITGGAAGYLAWVTAETR